MKSAQDPRHKTRKKTVQELFAASFTEQKVSPLTKKILKRAPKLDKQISKAAPTWPIEKLNKIDLAILRLAVYELDQGSVPPKVVIDEAVELAKELGGENSASFINGALGAILKQSKK